MDTIQQDIDARATAPRVTPADLEAEIHSEHYFTGEEGVLGAYKANGDRYIGSMPDNFSAKTLPLLTLCVLVLKNGIKLVGESACISAENFDAEIGRRLAREDALRKLWPLLGFRLADRLHASPVPVMADVQWSAEDLAEIARVGGEVRVGSVSPEIANPAAPPKPAPTVIEQFAEALEELAEERTGKQLDNMRRVVRGAIVIGDPRADCAAAIKLVDEQRPLVLARERNRLVRALVAASEAMPGS